MTIPSPLGAGRLHCRAPGLGQSHDFPGASQGWGCPSCRRIQTHGPLRAGKAHAFLAAAACFGIWGALENVLRIARTASQGGVWRRAGELYLPAACGFGASPRGCQQGLRQGQTASPLRARRPCAVPCCPLTGRPPGLVGKETPLRPRERQSWGAPPPCCGHRRAHGTPRRGNQGRGFQPLVKGGGECMLTPESSPRAGVGMGRVRRVQKVIGAEAEGRGKTETPPLSSGRPRASRDIVLPHRDPLVYRLPKGTGRSIQIREQDPEGTSGQVSCWLRAHGRTEEVGKPAPGAPAPSGGCPWVTRCPGKARTSPDQALPGLLPQVGKGNPAP